MWDFESYFKRLCGYVDRCMSFGQPLFLLLIFYFYSLSYIQTLKQKTLPNFLAVFFVFFSYFSYFIFRKYYPRIWSTDCGWELACPNMLWDACWRMLLLVKSIISLAISASLILDSACCRFSLVTSTFAILCSSLFWEAPRSDLWFETSAKALS